MKSVLRALALLLPAALVLAGCLQSPVQTATTDPPSALAQEGRLVTHTALALLPPADDAWRALDVRLAPVGLPGPEPTLGVASDGTIFTTVNGRHLARSTDHGLTWEVVTGKDAVRDPKTSLDPWMWLDPTTDRVYNAPLYVVCTWMQWSDDHGETWDFNPVAGCGIPAHDHQKVTTGAPAEGVKTSGYPNVVYYAYNSFRGEGAWVQRSLDGGKTFDLGQSVHPDDACHSGIIGPVAVAPDGTAYAPKGVCDGLDIAVSRDSGATWEITGRLHDVGGAPALAMMVDAAVDSAGNAYATWTGEDGLPYVTASTDAGRTWSAPKLVSPPGVNASVFNVITAGDEGRVVVGYVGTKADASKWKTKDAESADDKAVWHLFLSFTEDARADAPVWHTVQVTPDDDPVQVGCIWQSGGSNPCRNLLDFIDMVERDGRVYVVFADGCDKCKSASESRGREATLAIVERGPSLRAGGMLAPLVATG